MQIPKEYVDEFGMIVTGDTRDGGDSAFYMGHYYCLYELYEKQFTSRSSDNKRYRDDFIHRIQHYNGNIRRHCESIKWYGDWDRASRDQSIPFIIMLFLCAYKQEAWQFFKAHLKRGLLFTTNTRRNGVKDTPWKLPDITGPNFWSIYIRGFRALYFYPLLLIFDLFLFLNVMSFNLSPREPNQLLLLLAFSKERLPTPLSYLAFVVLNKGLVRLTSVDGQIYVDCFCFQ